LALHLLPGFLVGFFYFITAEVFVPAGLPRLLALLLGFLVVGIPAQLIVLRRASKRAGHSVIRYRTPLPLWHHVGGAVVLIVVVILLLRLPLGTTARYLAAHVFGFLPVAFAPSADDQLATLRHTIVLITLVLQLLIDGVVNPIVEETYFRGFLLPQLERLGPMAPIVNTLLFALGHFWQPYNYISIFVYVLPLTFFTWWKRNYYVQAFVHCLANSIGAVLALDMFFCGTL
jgi:membrane protease YdiL (CAAX protease family)